MDNCQNMGPDDTSYTSMRVRESSSQVGGPDSGWAEMSTGNHIGSEDWESGKVGVLC